MDCVFDAAGNDFSAPIAHHVLHERVVVDQLFGLALTLFGQGLVTAYRRVSHGADFYGQLNGWCALLRCVDGSLQFFSIGRVVERRAFNPERVGGAVFCHQLRLKRQLTRHGFDGVAGDKLSDQAGPEVTQLGAVGFWQLDT